MKTAALFNQEGESLASISAVKYMLSNWLSSLLVQTLNQRRRQSNRSEGALVESGGGGGSKI